MFGRTGGFGTQTASFGFGNSSTNTFGQSNQLFGSTPSSFNSTAPVFGSSTQPMFGSTPSSGTALFGTTSTSTFGQPNQSGFGTSLFGSSGQPSSSGIFGSSSATSFGQQNKPTGFGFPSSSGGGLFSQTSQQNQQNAPSVFQSSSATNLFGNTSTFGNNTGQMGTVIKFVPVTGTDSVQKSGIVQSINTKHHCITCMKEYEGKSLEELRFEDYQANRKGPQQQQQPFGQPQPFGISSTSASIFGQADKSTFGAPRTDFGAPSFGLGTQTTTPNIFGKSSTGFGTSTSSSGFPFATNTSSTGLFGSTNTNKPFAAPTNQIFGSTQPQQSSFGNVFGQTNTQNTGMFGKPGTSGFNTSQPGFTFGAPQNQPNLFQSSKPTTGFGGFGQSSQAPVFGQSQQNTFGLNSTFGKPISTFGQPTQPAFGTQSIFGNTQNKPLFGNNTSFFGNTFQQNTPFQFNSQQQQQGPSMNQLDSQTQELRALVQLTDPYGYNKHLEGLSPLKPTTPAYVTNPKDLQKLLESPPPIAVVSPMNKRLQVLPITAKKTNLFDEMLEREMHDVNYTLRTSAKRLLINKERQQRAESGRAESPPIVPLDVNETVDSRLVHNTTPQITTKLDITPVDKYKEKQQEQPQDSISSLMSINTNLMKETTPSDPHPNTLSTSVEVQDAQTSTRDYLDCIDIIEKPIDTCGVKLTRAEYYTVPPLDKLIEHKQPDGQCLVKGFTIGRVAYGNVCFPDLMDVSNLNLDELVYFRYREVTIYPDDIKKPPVGQGLNRRAQVTLDRVFPKSKMDRKLITDTEILISINFSDTLRDLCEKHGTKFLDYRPETGSWVFMVDHFSKYGFSDSDEEESCVRIADRQQLVKQLDEKKKKDQQKLKEELARIEDKRLREEILLNSKLFIEAESAKMIVEDDIYTVEITMEDSLGVHGASIESLDFDYHDINTIAPSQVLHHMRSRKNLYLSSPKDIYFMKASLYENEQFVPIDIEEHDIETITRSPLFKDFPVPTTEDVDVKEKVVRIAPKIFALENMYITTPDKAMYNDRNYMDMMVFKGTSFKVGWGRGMILTMQFNTGTSNHSSQPFIADQANGIVRLLDVSCLEDFDPFVDKLEEHLQVVLDTSDIIMEQNNIPLFTVKPGKTSLLRHQLVARQTACDHFENPAVAYYRQIWDLCASFWGHMWPPTNRRDLFSSWLEHSAYSDMQEELSLLDDNIPDTIFNKIFLNLTGNRVAIAAEIAAQAGFYNLSLLISQLNASLKTKSIMSRQLEDWDSLSASEHINPTLQKIYMLIAGKSIGGAISQSSGEPINICENLDWKRCLAIMLWYVDSSANDVSAAVELYRKDFEETGFSRRPLPFFSSREDIFDLMYHLILLHCGRGKPLETVLEPDTHSRIPTDYRLSWLLLHTLQSLQVGTVGTTAKTFMTSSFSEQLENLGLYKWSVFVLLFIEDINLRKSYIMGVLHRNLEQDDMDRLIEDEIVTELCVPSEWIHEVKAYKSDLLSMHWEAYKHFTYSNHWVAAINVAWEHLIPKLIVNDHFDMAGYILRDIEPGCSSIINWENEGGLLLTFLEIFERFQEEFRLTKEQAADMYNLLVRICGALSPYPTTNAAQVAALSEISKYCNLFGGLILVHIKPAYEKAMVFLATQLNDLVMPPDYKLTDLQSTESSTTYSSDQDDSSMESSTTS